MRQTLLLNIAVFGFFVLLFASLYRNKPLNRLKFWIGSWIWVLLHFLLLLWRPVSDFWSSAADAASVSALMLTGVWFLISVPVRSVRARNLTAAVLSGLCVALIALLYAPLGASIAQGGVVSCATLLVAILLQGAGLMFVWRYQGLAPAIGSIWQLRIPSTLLIVGCTAWSSVALWRGSASMALNALLMEIFTAYVLFFLQEFPLRTSGALTTVLGLLGWAAVFPVSLAIAAYWPHFSVEPEIWDVPKVFVAFGMLVTLLEDERTRSEREREQYQTLFDENPLAMWIYEPVSTRLTETNLAATRDFGWAKDELHTLTLTDLIAGEQSGGADLIELNSRLAGLKRPNPRRAAGVRQAVPDVARAEAVRLQTRDSRQIVAEATVQRIRFREQEARLLIVKDITAQAEARRQLIHLANHDPLTGLPNRLLLEDRMKTALANASRHGKKAAILCMDLDRFKQINDSFGHAAGDSCLCEVANRLRQRLRASDTAARTGGEEFVIVLDDIGNLEDVSGVASDILASLGVPHMFERSELSMSASIGIALYPDDSKDPSALWSMADAAMYRAKQGGGNRHLFFSSSR
jgi:diguanylate cyclase (GGDEF)-like protein/PAS domain S-box-containing protein